MWLSFRQTRNLYLRVKSTAEFCLACSFRCGTSLRRLTCLHSISLYLARPRPLTVLWHVLLPGGKQSFSPTVTPHFLLLTAHLTRAFSPLLYQWTALFSPYCLSL